MEFYAEGGKGSGMDMSFNSQRDGILRFWVNDLGIFISEFQFPTGWNSTKIRLTENITKGVSIPNGMEFYFGFGLRLL